MNLVSNSIYISLLSLTAIGLVWGLLSPIQRLPLWVQRHDKAWHVMAFALLAWLAHGCWPNMATWILWAALSVFGLIGEGLQQLTAHRRFCWRDAVANALGAALVLVFL